MSEMHLNQDTMRGMLKSNTLRREFKFLRQQFQRWQKQSGGRRSCCGRRRTVKPSIKTDVFQNIKNWVIGLKSTRPERMRKLKQMLKVEIIAVRTSNKEGKTSVVKL